MKKLLGVLLVFLTVLVFAFNISAASQTTLNFDLSCDGRNEVYKKTGDIITVKFTVENATDKNADYDISSLTNEIYYDHTFFEMVEGSASVESGLNITTRLAVYSSGEHRVYFNGFELPAKEYEAKQTVGTFQLKVIAAEGSSTVKSMGMIASSDNSYKIVSTDLVVKIGDAPVGDVYDIAFETNGGTSVGDINVTYGEKLTKPEDPKKDGKYFAGWYKDAECTEEWDFERDIVYGDTTLYAKWSDTPVDDTDIVPDNNWTPPEDNSDDYWSWLWWILIALIILILIFIIL